MANEYVWVTGKLNLSPETPWRNEAVRKAFFDATKLGPSTIYVLGSMFAPETSRDAMERFLKELPGRKVLVVEGSWTVRTASDNEVKLSGWHDTARYVPLELWGRKFQLSPDVRNMRLTDGLIVHVDDRIPDSQHHINGSWDACNSSELAGAGGLKNLYALSVIADQIGAGMVAEEPVDGG